MLLFIVPQIGSETVEAIRDNLNATLKHVTRFPLEAFEKHFSFITDRGATMPKVFGASISSNKVSFSQRWAGCITHQLNTVMKSTIERPPINISEISKTLTAIKNIVATVKHASLNDEMPEGYALLQEVTTRFGTTFDVVERFIKSASRLKILILQNVEMLLKKLINNFLFFQQKKNRMTQCIILPSMQLFHASHLFGMHRPYLKHRTSSR